MPTNLTPEQKTQYNTYRAAGLSPERALAIATKDSDNQFNPALEAGVDNILFGKKSLTDSVIRGVTEAVTGGAREIGQDIEKYGGGFAALKAPLSLAAGVGRGVGTIFAGGAETIDDLTGEVVSDWATPYVNEAVNSDVGQYMLQKASEWNESGRGIPGDILDVTNLLGVTAIAKSGVAKTIKESIVKSADDIVETGARISRSGNKLADFVPKPKVKASPSIQKIDVNLRNIEKILETKLDNREVVNALDDIRAEIALGNSSTFSTDVTSRLDEILKQNSDNEIDFSKLAPQERESIEIYIKEIEGVLNQPDAAKTVEDFLSGGLGRVDNIADKSVNVIENFSDDFIDSTLRTVEKVKSVPAAFSGKVKQAIDRRIVRVATNDPAQASENMLNLYKKAIVPGVKKKNKTIANVKSIDAAIQRSVPQLAKKYQVEDLEDFARAIDSEKRAIFSDIDKGLKAAGEEGRTVDMRPIVDELDKLSKSERAEFSKPLRDAIKRARAELVDELEDGTTVPKTVSPSGAQDIIADLNAQLQSYYRGSTPGTNADVIVDNLVVNNLRKSTDNIVDDLGEGSFKELKGRYADLKKMEDDVVHRAVFEAQKGGGLADISNIISAGNITAGSLNPAFLAKGVAQFATKEVLKSLNDKDELVRQMFLYGKNIE